ATLYTTYAAVAFAAPVIGFLVYAFAPLTPGLRLAVAAGLVSVAVRGLLKMAQERRRAAGDVKGFALIEVLATGGGCAVGIGLAFAGMGAAPPFAGIGAVALFCLVLALPPELKTARAGRFEPARFRRYAAYGLPLSWSLALSLALASTDRF